MDKPRAIAFGTLVLVLSLTVASQGAPAANDSTLTAAGADVGPLPYAPVITPNGSTLPFTIEGGVKVFTLTAEPCKHEVAPGMIVNAWCFNGRTPGPTIEAVEGDRVRILVTNKLPEPTAVHWHGVILPSGMDGVAGLSQQPIPPGDTFAYEFTLNQHGTQMYHSHGDEMVQIGLGTMGFFIIHPRERQPRIDRDFALFLNEWFIEPGTATPNPNVMTDFNIFTFNSRAFPGTAPLLARTGDRVRLRIGNVGQECHPIHLHGHTFNIVATDGGDIPPSAQWPETTVHVCPGQTRDVEFVANAGDWAMHCHRRHHPMNAMGHDVPLMIGVKQGAVERDIRSLLPDYMAMGETGMHEHATMHHHNIPENTLPMMAGEGPFGPIGMGGMFTILKVRDALPTEGDAGWYDNPPGTVAESTRAGKDTGAAAIYRCPMHSEVQRSQPGSCPKCGMALRPGIAGETID
jgi:FtsP/CotA-like multicopper oxidase with cupredoxin domain